MNVTLIETGIKALIKMGKYLLIFNLSLTFYKYAHQIVWINR